MTVQHVKNKPWELIQNNGEPYLKLTIKDTPKGLVECYLTLRPHYCDRGHLMLIIDGRLELDQHDSFPRYFFSFDEANRHTRDFLLWRLYKIRQYAHELFPKHRKGCRVDVS